MDVNFWVPIIVAIIAAAPGGFALWRQARLEERKQPQATVSMGMDASKTAAEVVRQYSQELIAVRAELKSLRDNLDLLQGQIEQKEQLIEEWRLGIERLIAQVVSLGHKPVWRPRANVEREG